MSMCLSGTTYRSDTRSLVERDGSAMPLALAVPFASSLNGPCTVGSDQPRMARRSELHARESMRGSQHL